MRSIRHFFGGCSFDNGELRIEQYYIIRDGKRVFYFRYTHADGRKISHPMNENSARLAEKWLAKHKEGDSICCKR